MQIVRQGISSKVAAFHEILEENQLSTAEVAYIGDDVTDLSVIRCAGFGVTVANAVDEVKQYADYVTTRPGGSGAVREVIEYILKNSDRWQPLLNRYLP